jgi:hypothetical protein
MFAFYCSFLSNYVTLRPYDGLITHLKENMVSKMFMMEGVHFSNKAVAPRGRRRRSEEVKHEAEYL